jgi:deazaflavin-dependent oxidoreductase (nitroreductase family)
VHHTAHNLLGTHAWLARPQLNEDPMMRSALAIPMSTAKQDLVGMTRTSHSPGRKGGGHPLQAALVNPLVKLAFRVGFPDPGDALLETIGRRTGEPRLTPVCDGLDGDTFWLLAQRGRASDWVRNIEMEPRVRVQLRSRRPTRWRSGTAYILEDDDPHERQRMLERGKPWRRLCLRTSAGQATDLLTVRVDLDPDAAAR